MCSEIVLSVRFTLSHQIGLKDADILTYDFSVYRLRK
jgi:hypothetical protein